MPPVPVPVVVACTGASPVPTEVERVAGSAAASERDSGIVAAGVKDDDADRRVRRQRRQDLLDLDGARLEMRRRGQFGIDRDQEIVAFDLHAVAGIIDQRHLRVIGGLGEAVDRVDHAGLVEIGALDDLEARVAQRRRDQIGVIGRVGKRDGMDIFAVADDQRDALCVVGRRHARQRRPQCQHRDLQGKQCTVSLPDPRQPSPYRKYTLQTRNFATGHLLGKANGRGRPPCSPRRHLVMPADPDLAKVLAWR